MSTAVWPDIAEAPLAANSTAASSCCQLSGLPVCIRTTPGSSLCQGPPGAQRRAVVLVARPAARSWREVASRSWVRARRSIAAVFAVVGVGMDEFCPDVTLCS